MRTGDRVVIRSGKFAGSSGVIVCTEDSSGRLLIRTTIGIIDRIESSRVRVIPRLMSDPDLQCPVGSAVRCSHDPWVGFIGIVTADDGPVRWVKFGQFEHAKPVQVVYLAPLEDDTN